MQSGRRLAVLFAAVGNNSTANEINCAHTDNCMEAPPQTALWNGNEIHCTYAALVFSSSSSLQFLYMHVRRRPKAIVMFVTLQPVRVRELPFSAAVQIFMWLPTHRHSNTQAGV